MILLSGHSLTEAGLIREEALSVTLSERDSKATLTPENMTGITVNSWLKGNVGPGNGIVWRVKSIEQAYHNRTPRVELEHVVCALKDLILFGEITPATITGNDSATTCTALQTVNYILNRTSDWTLGTMDSAYKSVTNAYKFNGQCLYDALVTVTETLEDAWWSYDLTAFPFKLNITAKPSGTACELRAGRNLRTISKTIDRTGMYTRFYPIGKDDLHITGSYVSKNESTYGVIAHVETDQTLTTEAELTAWANRRLDRHAEPKVSVTADGLELADATGVPLDRLRLGRICRVPLPEFGTTIEERIVELSYQDAVFRPEEVRITMANTRDDVTTILADAIKKGDGPTGSASRQNGVQSKTDHAWFEDTDTRVAMVVGTNSGGNYIKAGEIALAINTSTGQSIATINADHIMIGNENAETVINGKLNVDDLTAQLIQSKIGQIELLSVQGLAASEGISCTDFISGDSLQANSFMIGGHSFTDCIISATVSTSTNTLTLTYASGSSVNFSKSAPVTLTPSWSGSDFTVAASSGQSITESFSTSKGSGQGGSVGGLVTIDAYDASHYGYAYVKGTRIGSGNGVLYRIVADATGVYSDGVTAGEISGAAAAKAAVTLSSAWTGSAANGWTFTVSNSANSRTSATTITRTVGTWTNHKLNIRIEATNKPESRLWQWDVDATGVYNSVTVDSISAPNQTSSATATLTATAANGNTKTRSIVVTNSGFSGGSATAQIRLDSANGTIIAQRQIDMPSAATWDHQKFVSTWFVSCTVGGKQYSTSFPAT